jgi:hypothetical protein
VHKYLILLKLSKVGCAPQHLILLKNQPFNFQLRNFFALKIDRVPVSVSRPFFHCKNLYFSPMYSGNLSAMPQTKTTRYS